MPSLAELINAADTSFREAKAANELRYSQILAGYEERKAATLRVLQQSFTDEKARLAADYGVAAGETRASAQRRGLGSVADDLAGGLESDRGFAERQLQGWYEPAAKLTEITQSVDKLRAIEDRRDVYPDAALYAKVVEQLGRAKALQGFQDVAFDWAAARRAALPRQSLGIGGRGETFEERMARDFGSSFGVATGTYSGSFSGSSSSGTSRSPPQGFYGQQSNGGGQLDSYTGGYSDYGNAPPDIGSIVPSYDEYLGVPSYDWYGSSFAGSESIVPDYGGYNAPALSQPSSSVYSEQDAAYWSF